MFRNSKGEEAGELALEYSDPIETLNTLPPGRG